MTEGYIEVQTTDNTTVNIQINHISAVEEIAGTARSEGYLKLYIAGYSFNVKINKDDLMALLEASKK